MTQHEITQQETPRDNFTSAGALDATSVCPQCGHRERVSRLIERGG